jgi:hypothetical protein
MLPIPNAVHEIQQSRKSLGLHLPRPKETETDSRLVPHSIAPALGQHFPPVQRKGNVPHLHLALLCIRHFARRWRLPLVDRHTLLLAMRCLHVAPLRQALHLLHLL